MGHANREANATGEEAPNVIRRRWVTIGAISRLLLAAHGGLLVPGAAAAQQWNTPEALGLVRRGVERRREAAADSALRGYRTSAHGVVFFLAQIGAGLTAPPRLVKADELKVEVYWQAPDVSKQVIRAWRDGSFLPTDINYHRDHLAIVTNNFGDLIRIGEGDEVKDAVHPLSTAGLEQYDFALGDSLAIRGAQGEVRVREVLVRPRDFRGPLVVGRLYLDAATAQLVRFRFSFTPAAYLDRQLEDISVVLENSLQEGRFWLPYRQEIEIRRRVSWLDFPARGIIRGQWDIGDYELGVAIPPAVLAGPDIGGLEHPRPADSSWTEPLGTAIGEAAPVDRRDMDALRGEIEHVAGAHALSGLAATRLAAGSVSDLVHVNRVQGLALGVGGTIGLGASRVLLRPRVGLGTSDGRVTGGLAIEAGLGAMELRAFGRREIRDFSDVPVISPALNTLLAQEGGHDHGDYVLLDAAGVGLRRRLGGRTAVGVELGVARSGSVAVAASPARGAYRPNPPLGAGTYGVGRLAVERRSGGMTRGGDLAGSLALEIGDGPTDYVRAAGDATWLAGLGPTALRARFGAGIGSGGLPAYRSFVLGGRGTLVGEPYRAYGGRRFALAQLEWRVDVPVPAIPLGSFASTGHTMVLAPFVAAGWTDRAYTGLPWVRTEGIRPVAGLAAEWFMRLIRVEAGFGLRGGGFGLTIDISPDWWGLL